jgi:hypothetical protein
MLGFVSLVLVGLVLSLGSGILASFLTERVDIGIAVTSGVAGVISCLETFLFWVYCRRDEGGSAAKARAGVPIS